MSQNGENKCLSIEWNKIEQINSVHHCRCIYIWSTCRLYWTYQSGESKLFVCVIGCTQCIQSSSCLIQKYPVSFVTLGHCAVLFFVFFCSRVHACMFSNTVLNKFILLSINLTHELIYCRYLKYTVYNDYRNKRSCTVHQSTNIQILKVFSQVWIHTLSYIFSE